MNFLEKNWKDPTNFRLEQLKELTQNMNEGNYWLISIWFAEVSSLFDILPNEQTNNFPFIKMVRHWLFHSGVSRSKTASKMLKDMSLNFLNFHQVNGLNVKMDINNIRDFLIIPLFKELELFSKKFNIISIDLSTKEKKQLFLSSLFLRLAFKPLSHPENNEKNRNQNLLKHYDKMINNVYNYEPLYFYKLETIEKYNDQDNILFNKYKNEIPDNQKRYGLYYIFRWMKIVINEEGKILFVFKSYCDTKDINQFSGVIQDTEGLLDNI